MAGLVWWAQTGSTISHNRTTTNTRVMPSTSPHSNRTLIFGLLALFASAGRAHDFWIEAQPFYLETGDRIELGLYVGVDLVGEPQLNIPEFTRDFSFISTTGQFPVQGELGREPAGYFHPDVPGTYLAGFQTNPQFVEMPAEKFNEYLAEEGLEPILALRRERGESDKTAREYYQRCAKSIMVNRSSGTQPPLGHAFLYNYEIMPQGNPYTTDGQLTVQVLFKGEPIENAQVVAFTKQAPMNKQAVRSDAEGLARFDVSAPGMWMIKSVRMEPLDRKDAEWISYWASLTFERRRDTVSTGQVAGSLLQLGQDLVDVRPPPLGAQ